MTLVDTGTGEILDVEEAERRASYICTDLDAAAGSFEHAMGLMRQAITERDDIALGYRSPGDYVSDRFGGRLSRLGVDLRREVVRELTEAGMSTRAIAPVVGVDQKTVVRDRRAGEANASPAPSPVVEAEVPDSAESVAGDTSKAVQSEGEVIPPGANLANDGGAPRPPVTGIDGKTYAAPTHRPTAVPKPAPEPFDDQDKAEELAGNLARNLSLLYAITNPDRRADYIATWVAGTRDRPALGQQFVTPKHMRALAEALRTFASEWENANV